MVGKVMCEIIVQVWFVYCCGLFQWLVGMDGEVVLGVVVEVGDVVYVQEIVVIDGVVMLQVVDVVGYYVQVVVYFCVEVCVLCVQM